MGVIEERARKKANSRAFQQCVLVAVALYVSSYGAVSAFHAQHIIDGDAFAFWQNTLFRPLNWFSERSEVARNFLHWWEFIWLS